MLQIRSNYSKSDSTTVWSKLEDVFEYMSKKEIEEVYFSPKDNFFTGFNEKDFQTFSRELFDSIKEEAHSKFWYDDGTFERIRKTYKGQNYSIKVYESHPDAMNVYDTIHAITITREP